MTVNEYPSPPYTIHNPQIGSLIKDTYTPQDLSNISSVLNSKKSLVFPTIQNRGLFKAALSHSQDEKDYTGYDNVWVRDNIHVAHAHLVMGKHEMAVGTVKDLIEFWMTPGQMKRWEGCIKGILDFDGDVMLRPHIRFNGTELKENAQKFAHAQNDALGYFLWLTSSLLNQHHLQPTHPTLTLLTLVPLFYNTINFHTDKDSGHWEEARKLQSSSLGPATAGLSSLLEILTTNQEVSNLLQKSYSETITRLGLTTVPISLETLVKTLVANGMKALTQLLPNESTDRKTDAALLFLLYPLRLSLPSQTKHAIITNVINDLSGPHGIRRYRGDSYWMADYKNLFSEETRTADFSDDMGSRDKFLKEGEEAQWCLFDSIVSCAYGDLYIAALRNGSSPSDPKVSVLKKQQVHFFNRSLAQITGKDTCPFGEFLFPESYYIEKGKYVTNDVCPLLWTQANFICALRVLEESLEVEKGK